MTNLTFAPASPHHATLFPHATIRPEKADPQRCPFLQHLLKSLAYFYLIVFIAYFSAVRCMIAGPPWKLVGRHPGGTATALMLDRDRHSAGQVLMDQSRIDCFVR